MGEYADMSIDDGLASYFLELEEQDNNIFNDPIDGQIIRRTPMSTQAILENIRLSYLAWHEPRETPSGDMKYQASILIDKKDKKNIGRINEAVEAAIKKGLEDGKFNKSQVKGLRRPMRDGSEEFENGNRGEEYNGHFFLNSASNRQPGVLMLHDGRRIPVIDPDDVYSGCIAHIHVNFFPYNTAGNRGVGVGLNNILKVADADRLDGRVSADAAFKEFGEEAEEDEEAAF